MKEIYLPRLTSCRKKFLCKLIYLIFRIRVIELRDITSNAFLMARSDTFVFYFHWILFSFMEIPNFYFRRARSENKRNAKPTIHPHSVYSTHVRCWSSHKFQFKLRMTTIYGERWNRWSTYDLNEVFVSQTPRGAKKINRKIWQKASSRKCFVNKIKLLTFHILSFRSHTFNL